MCIFDKEFKKKDEKRNTGYVSSKKSYKPRKATLFIGKNNKQNPIPSYWKLR